MVITFIFNFYVKNNYLELIYYFIINMDSINNNINFELNYNTNLELDYLNKINEQINDITRQRLYEFILLQEDKPYNIVNIEYRIDDTESFNDYREIMLNTTNSTTCCDIKNYIKYIHELENDVVVHLLNY